ncbi:MAG: hypothetical protein ABUL72_04535 [Armatimonadota bacterium]
MRRAIFLVLVALAAIANAQPFPILGNKEKSLALMPARVLFTGMPGAHAVSPGGRYIGWCVGDAGLSDAYRDIAKVIMPNALPEFPNYRFMVYDRETKTTEDRGGLSRPALPTLVYPLGNTGSFLIQSALRDATPNLNKRGSTLISQVGDRQLGRGITLAEDEDIEADPFSGYWMITKRIPEKSSKVSVYDASLRPVWSQEVKGYSFIYKGKLVLPRAQRGGQGSQVDLATGKIEAQQPIDDAFDEPQSPFLHWLYKSPERTESYVSPKLTVQVNGEKEVEVMAAEIHDFYADPQDQFILYSDGDAILMREMFLVDPDAVKKAKEARQRQALLNRAKQVGIGMMIYGADYDDMLPPGDKWSDRLYPYLKNNDLSKDFVFLLPGVNMSSITNPATTMLGFITGPGGMAVVYADGHAVWSPHG